MILKEIQHWAADRQGVDSWGIGVTELVFVCGIRFVPSFFVVAVAATA